MKEAKKRNPDIKLYGLPWGWAGWLDPNATATRPAQSAFFNPAVTANYTLQWLLGAKREHGLDIDYIGQVGNPESPSPRTALHNTPHTRNQWNERDAPEPYNEALAVAVKEAGLETFPLKRLPHYPGTTDIPDKQGCTQYEWNSTDGSRWVDEEGSWMDGRSSRCLARCLNRNYISGCHTSTFQWHLISSFYDFLPWARCGVAVANTPWSGHYEITSPLWTLAHTSQFAPIGWRYASHGKGVGMLSKGGSFVTRISPDSKDFSLVVEKMSGGGDSNCARGSNPPSTALEEVVTWHLQGSFAKATTLQVWYSNLTDANDGNPNKNPADSQMFQQLAPISVGADGKVELTVRPDEVYTLTTLTTGRKGAAASGIPAPAPLSLPYMQSFDNEPTSSPPALWYDQVSSP
jgi:galactosylceramidase